MASAISLAMAKVAEHVEETTATTGITKCFVGINGQAKLPYVCVVKSRVTGYHMDINQALDKEFMLDFGIWGSEEQVDLIIETLQDLWLDVSDTPYQEMYALGVWELSPVPGGSHPSLFGEDSTQDGNLIMRMVLRSNYTT